MKTTQGWKEAGISAVGRYTTTNTIVILAYLQSVD